MAVMRAVGRCREEGGTTDYFIDNLPLWTKFSRDNYVLKDENQFLRDYWFEVFASEDLIPQKKSQI